MTYSVSFFVFSFWNSVLLSKEEELFALLLIAAKILHN